MIKLLLIRFFIHIRIFTLKFSLFKFQWVHEPFIEMNSETFLSINFLQYVFLWFKLTSNIILYIPFFFLYIYWQSLKIIIPIFYAANSKFTLCDAAFSEAMYQHVISWHDVDNFLSVQARNTSILWGNAFNFTVMIIVCFALTVSSDSRKHSSHYVCYFPLLIKWRGLGSRLWTQG